MAIQFIESRQITESHIYRATGLVLLMAHTPGSHKFRGLDEMADGKSIQTAHGRLPLIVDVAEPEVDERKFNDALIHSPFIIAALKGNPGLLNPELLSDSADYFDFYNKAVFAARSRRLAKGRSVEQLDLMGGGAYLLRGSSDVIVDYFDPLKRVWKPMNKPKGEIDDIKRHNKELLSTVPDIGLHQFRSRVGLTVQGISFYGNPLKLSVGVSLESFFWVKPTSRTEFEELYRRIPDDVVMNVNGGLPFADYLRPLVVELNNGVNGKANGLSNEEIFTYRLLGQTPELLNLAGELVNSVKPIRQRGCNDVASPINNALGEYLSNRPGLGELLPDKDMAWLAIPSIRNLIGTEELYYV